MYDESDEMAKRVGDDMAHAPLDLLSCVKAAQTAAFRGFGRLAVDQARRRARLGPTRSRAAMTSVWLIEANVPSREHS